MVRIKFDRSAMVRGWKEGKARTLAGRRTGV